MAKVEQALRPAFKEVQAKLSNFTVSRHILPQ